MQMLLMGGVREWNFYKSENICGYSAQGLWHTTQVHQRIGVLYQKPRQMAGCHRLYPNLPYPTHMPTYHSPLATPPIPAPQPPFWEEANFWPVWASLARITEFGAAALRHIIQRLNEPTLLTDTLSDPAAWWPASPTVMNHVLEGCTRKDKLIAAWNKQQHRTPTLPHTMAQQLDKLGITLVMFGSTHYAPLLAQCHNPPAVLFVRGNTRLLNSKTLAMVGTRTISDYGQRAASHLVSQLAPYGPTIVSGLADGVDGACHRAALSNNLPTIAVFGTGIDSIFPTRHTGLAADILSANGALISEYPPGTPGQRSLFPQRNRIIAGLSHGVVVVEGHIKSGSLITAHLALEENRSVFAVPGTLFNPGSAGPHQLLQQGAVPALSGEAIAQELHWLTKPTTPITAPTEHPDTHPPHPTEPNTALPPEQHALLALIPYDPTPIEHIAKQSSLPTAELTQHLTLLELLGHIATAPGACILRR